MVKFIGEYKAKLDDKGRLVFPSAFKSMCPDVVSGGFIVRKNLFDDCLEMFALPDWERESEAARSKINTFTREGNALWRAYTRSCAMVVPDEKMGRISIPKDLLAAVGIEKEVVFCGQDHKIEIWSKEKLDAATLPADEFVSLAEELLGK